MIIRKKVLEKEIDEIKNLKYLQKTLDKLEYDENKLKSKKEQIVENFSLFEMDEIKENFENYLEKMLGLNIDLLTHKRKNSFEGIDEYLIDFSELNDKQYQAEIQSLIIDQKILRPDEKDPEKKIFPEFSDAIIQYIKDYYM